MKRLSGESGGKKRVFQKKCLECGEGLVFGEKKRLEDNTFVFLEKCTQCDYCKQIDRALRVMADPLNELLWGRKTWEMRGTRCNIRERVGLIRIGANEVVGAMDIIDSTNRLSDEELELQVNRDKHQADPEVLKKKNWRYGWVVKDARKFVDPVPFKHMGAWSWVKLTSGVLE